MRTLGTLAALSLLCWLGGCDTLFRGFSVIPPEEPYRPPVTKTLAAVLARPKPGDPAVYPLLQDVPRSSLDFVVVRDRISPRYHERSDVTVYVLEGEGDVLLERQWLRLAAGTLIHVPMNVAYGFVNRHDGGSRLLVTYTPPHVEGDVVKIAEEEP